MVPCTYLPHFCRRDASNPGNVGGKNGVNGCTAPFSTKNLAALGVKHATKISDFFCLAAVEARDEKGDA